MATKEMAARFVQDADMARRMSALRLKQAQRNREEAMLAAYENGMPFAEIMEITGLSQPNVSRCFRRARSRRRNEHFDG
jgi:hypothetical protein